MEFVPPNKRTEEYFRSVFEAVGLADIVKLHKAQASQEAKRDLQQLLLDDLADNRPLKDIILDLKEMAQKSGIPEHEVIGLVIILLWLLLLYYNTLYYIMLQYYNKNF